MDGLEVTVRWDKDDKLGSYVGIESHVSYPHAVPEALRKAMERVADHCTVDRTIRNTADIPVSFHYGK